MQSSWPPLNAAPPPRPVSPAACAAALAGTLQMPACLQAEQCATVVGTSSAMQDKQDTHGLVHMGIAREHIYPAIRHDILRPPGAAGSTTAASAGSTGGSAGLKRGSRVALRNGFLAIPLSSCMSSGAQGSNASSSSCSSSCCAAPGRCCCCCSAAVHMKTEHVSRTVRRGTAFVGPLLTWIINVAGRQARLSSTPPCSSCSHCGPSSSGPQSMPPPSSS